jgi:hypothetical protein
MKFEEALDDISRNCRNKIMDGERIKKNERHIIDSYQRLKLQKEYNEKVMDLLYPNQRPSIVGVINDSNPKCEYEFVRFDKIETKHPIEYIDANCIDYVVKNIDKEGCKLKEDMPVSFLSIKEGDIESGKMWYKHYDPKLPDELCEMLARHNWGDLKYMNKKSIKRDNKKLKKKGKDIGVEMGLTIKRTDKNNPIIVDFD